MLLKFNFEIMLEHATKIRHTLSRFCMFKHYYSWYFKIIYDRMIYAALKCKMWFKIMYESFMSVSDWSNYFYILNHTFTNGFIYLMIINKMNLIIYSFSNYDGVVIYIFYFKRPRKLNSCTSVVQQFYILFQNADRFCQ